MNRTPIPLTESQRVWLQELYERCKEQRPIDPLQMQIELRDRLSKEFLPSQISFPFAQGNRITLVGIFAIDPESQILKDTERVILEVRKSLFAQPQIRTFSADQIAERLEMEPEYVGESETSGKAGGLIREPLKAVRASFGDCLNLSATFATP